MNRPAGSALAALGLLLVGGLVSTLTAPDAVTATAQGQVPVQRATAVCPRPAGGAEGLVTGFVPQPAGDGQPAAKAPGTAVFTDLANAGQTRGSVAAIGRLSTITVGAGAPTMVARADGADAPGFAAEQTTQVTGGPEAGLASVACVAPGADFWFLGSSAGANRQANLYLANGEDAPAQVDVILYGPNGPLDAPAGRGRTIGPHSQADPILLSSLVTGAPPVVAAHVIVHTGRLAAALSDLQTKNNTEAQGIDWVPVSAAPARQVVLPGIPPDASSLQLQLLAPGEQDANVKLRMAGKTATFTPTVPNTQNGSVTAPAGRVLSFDLAGITHNEESALVLTADQPILAGIRATRSTSGSPDVGFIAGVGGLSPGQRAVLPDNRVSKAFASTLFLTAPGAAGTVEVAVVGSGAPKTQTVTVPAGATVGVPLSSPGGDVFAVVAAPGPGSGTVFGARLLAQKSSDGSGFTIQPLGPAREGVTVPHIDNEQSTAVRR